MQWGWRRRQECSRRDERASAGRQKTFVYADSYTPSVYMLQQRHQHLPAAGGIEIPGIGFDDVL